MSATAEASKAMMAEDLFRRLVDAIESQSVPRELYSLDEAQRALGGISRETFNDYVRPHVGIVFIGNRPYVKARDLTSYVDKRAKCAMQ